MGEPAEDAEEVPELVPDAGPHKFQGLKKIDQQWLAIEGIMQKATGWVLMEQLLTSGDQMEKGVSCVAADWRFN